MTPTVASGLRTALKPTLRLPWKELRAAVAAWVRERNALGAPVHWHFTAADAHTKLRHLHPTFE